MKHPMHRNAGVLVVVVFAVTSLLPGFAESSGGEPAPSSGPVSDAPKELNGLPERWREAMKDLDVPGMAIVVVRGDEVIYSETFGERDPEKHLPVTPDTMFYIASCTKSYMAMAVLTLVEEGKIELDAPVKRYLPRFQVADASLTETLTVRDLLSHAKGLSSDPIVSLDAYTGEITEERFYRWLKEAKAKGVFDYTNLHYTLLGRVVESVTGKPWKEFLDERIFRPAGMSRTTAYASRMYGDADAAIPCDWADGKLVPTRVRKTDRVMHAAGGLGSSIQDLGRWLRLNLNGGTIDGTRVVSAASVAEMQKLQARAKEPMHRGQRTREGYGLGWCVGPYHGKPMMDHGGGYVGAAALITFMPEEGLGVAVVANASRPIAELVTFDVFSRLLDVEAPDDLPRLKKLAGQRRERTRERDKQFASGAVDAKALSLPPVSYAGTYEHGDWGTVTIDATDGRLSIRWGDVQFRVRSDGTDRFFADSGSGDPDKAFFELDGQRVSAVVITVDADSGLDARFARK